MQDYPLIFKHVAHASTEKEKAKDIHRLAKIATNHSNFENAHLHTSTLPHRVS